ncbi:hypothetical protein FOXB_04067, partial [Fusarium oxysporum f. sp. conglutinans Fo5176]
RSGYDETYCCSRCKTLAKCEDPEVIRGWFELMENIIAKYGIDATDIYNFDETGFMMGVILTAWKPGMGYGAPKRQFGGPLPQDWVIATTDNGWITNEIGLEWVKYFDKLSKSRTTGDYRLLILDGYESHYSADQFAKGARGIMHQIDLFKSEVQILREENETLSRRRHVKKKRLRQGGSLMLRHGQDLQGQNDVDVQLHEESRGNGCLKRKAGSEQRRCGVCGRTGHNARSFQIEVAVS